MGTFSVLRGVMVLVLASDAFASSPPAPNPRCQQRDSTERTQMLALLERVRTGANPPTTVDEFLALVPQSMRENMIFMTQSRSLQNASVTNPRVIIKSPNSDVTLSFNMDATNPVVELAMWNGANGRLELKEVRFPGDPPPPSGSATSTRPVVENDPSRCFACHGAPPNTRHVWDTYRAWAGQTPFAEDALHRGSVEVDWYRNIMRGITGVPASGSTPAVPPLPRMRHLRPLDSMATIDAGLARTTLPEPGLFQIRANRGETTQTDSVTGAVDNTPALDLSHQLLKTNGCRIAASLRDRPDWENIKNAVAGALIGCSPMSNDFLGTAGNRNAQSYFVDRGISASGTFSYPALRDDTDRRQRSLAVDKEGRQLWQFERYFRDNPTVRPGGCTSSFDCASREMDRIFGNMINNEPRFVNPGGRLATFEDSGQQMTATRYLLEPLGINVGEWSMAIDPGSYAHNQFFGEICLDTAIQSVLTDAGMSGPAARSACNGGGQTPPAAVCTALASASRTAVRIPTGSGTISRSAAYACETPDILQREASLRPIVETECCLLRQEAARIVRDEQCIMCHAPATSGAPPIPFNDINALEREIRLTRGRVGDFGERIWDRIARHPDSYGAMPQGMGSVERTNKVALRRWLNSLGTCPAP